MWTKGKYVLRLLSRKGHQAWSMFRLSIEKFLKIDGTKWAGAFAFNTFLSLFPLMILLVTITSLFVDRDLATAEVSAYMKKYVPLNREMQGYIFNTFAGVISTRKQVGAIAILILVWSSLQSFITLIMVTNRAWGMMIYSWWRFPLKSLALLGTTTGAILFGIMAPALIKITEGWLLHFSDFFSPALTLVSFFIPLLVVFSGLSLFYRFAPLRPARFSQVWFPALCVMLLLMGGENLFVVYLKKFARLNAIYGAFGGITALLIWVFISGCIFIFGACMCAANSQIADKQQGSEIPTQ
jgi:YihY family inner membrane protein